MSRTIPTALKPSLYRLYSEPIQLIDLYLESPYTSPSHFYCVNNQDIVFGGHTYIAIAAKRSAIKSEEGTVLQEITVQLDNIDLEFKNLIASGMFNRKKCDIKIVFNGYLSSSSNYIMLYSGYLDSPSGDNRWATLTVKPFPLFEREYPRRLFQVMCNWLFCSTQCGLTLTDYRLWNDVDSGSTTSIIQVKTYAMTPDYYIPGYVIMLSGSLEGQVRPVSWNSANQIGLRVAFDGVPAEDDSFHIQKLCAKNVTSCQDFSNYLNYGGFPHVPLEPTL